MHQLAFITQSQQRATKLQLLQDYLREIVSGDEKMNYFGVQNDNSHFIGNLQSSKGHQEEDDRQPFCEDAKVVIQSRLLYT